MPMRLNAMTTATRPHGKPTSDAVVDDDNGRDERPQQHEELPLLHEVGLARGVDELGHLAHRRVHGQPPELDEGEDAEPEAEGAHREARDEQGASGGATHRGDGAEVGQDKAGFAAMDAALGVGGGGRRRAAGEDEERGRQPAERAEARGQVAARSSG